MLALTRPKRKKPDEGTFFLNTPHNSVKHSQFAMHSKGGIGTFGVLCFTLARRPETLEKGEGPRVPKAGAEVSA